jgi:hypothetical protein
MSTFRSNADGVSTAWILVWFLLFGLSSIALFFVTGMTTAAQAVTTFLVIGGLSWGLIRLCASYLLGFTLIFARVAVVFIIILYVTPYYSRTTGSDSEIYHSFGDYTAKSLRWNHSLPELDFNGGTANYTYFTGVVYLFFGPSMLRIQLLNTLVAGIGSLLFLRGFEFNYGSPPRWFRAALLLWPSMLFWTSLHGKDPWTYLFLAVEFYSFGKLLRTQSIRATGLFFCGLSGLCVLRPQIAILILVASIITTWRAQAVDPVLRFTFAKIRVLLVVGVLAALAILIETNVDRLNSDGLVRGLSTMLTQLSTGGSGVDIPALYGWKDLLLFIPQGMSTVMFRPFPWESGNLFVKMASLEQLFLSAAIVTILAAASTRLIERFRVRRDRVRARSTNRDPFVLFVIAYCVGFIVLFSISANIGTLEREREQLFPFVFCAAYALVLNNESSIRRRLRRYNEEFGGPTTTVALS